MSFKKFSQRGARPVVGVRRVVVVRRTVVVDVVEARRGIRRRLPPVDRYQHIPLFPARHNKINRVDFLLPRGILLVRYPASFIG